MGEGGKGGFKDLASTVGHGNLWGEDRVIRHPEKPQDIVTIINLRKTVEDLPISGHWVGGQKEVLSRISSCEMISN